MDWPSSKEYIQVAVKRMKKRSTSTSYQWNAYQNHQEIPLHIHQYDYSHKREYFHHSEKFSQALCS